MYDVFLNYKYVDNLPIFMLLYVDDILLMSPNMNFIESVKCDLN